MENPRFAADEAAGLEMVGAAETLAGQDPFDADLQLGERVRRAVERDRLLARKLDVSLDVVLQVLADAGQMLDDRDSERLEGVGVADPRQHQHLRRVDRAAAQDHLAPYPRIGVPAVLDILDAGRAAPLEHNARDERARLYRDTPPPLRRAKIGARSTPAPTLVGRHVHPTEAFLLVAVHVLGHGIAGLPSRLDERLIERVLARSRGDEKRALVPPVGVAALEPGLGFLEIGQAVAIRPVLEPLLPRPRVIVEGMTADIDHAVDRR